MMKNGDLPTVTVKVQKFEKPEESVAVHVTTVDCPMGKVDPDAGLHWTLGLGSTRSNTVGLGQETRLLLATKSAGHVIGGAV